MDIDEAIENTEAEKRKDTSEENTVMKIWSPGRIDISGTQHWWDKGRQRAGRSDPVGRLLVLLHSGHPGHLGKGKPGQQ